MTPDLLTPDDGATARVQLARALGDVLPCPPDAVRCDGATGFANPFHWCGSVSPLDSRWWVEGDAGGVAQVWRCAGKREAQARAVQLHRSWIGEPGQTALRAKVRDTFRGKRPACFCDLDAPCHGDTLAEIAATAPECPLL